MVLKGKPSRVDTLRPVSAVELSLAIFGDLSANVRAVSFALFNRLYACNNSETDHLAILHNL